MADNKIKLVLGGHGSGKSDWLYNHFLLNSRKKGDESKSIDLNKKFYLVVPEQDTNDRQRTMMGKAKEYGLGILNIDVVSFDRLAHIVFEILNIEPEKENVIQDDAKTMILSLVVSKLAKENKIEYYKKMIQKVGFSKKLTQVVSEFYSYNVTDEDIDKVIANSKNDYFKSKLHDLKNIYTGFKQELIKKNFTIKEDKYNLLNENIEKVDIFNDAVFAFDGFTGFTPIQLEIFKKLARASKETYVSIDYRNAKLDNTKNSMVDVFYLSEKFARDIKDAATSLGYEFNDKNVIIKNDFSKFENLEDLSHLEKNIYNYENRKVLNIVPQNIKLYAAKNISEEILNAVQIILRLVRSNECKYNDIKIVIPNLEGYSDSLQKAFIKYNIPYFIDDTKTILNSPYIEVVRAAIEVVNFNFSYDTVMRYLNSGLFVKDSSINKLDNFIKKYGFIGSKRYKTGFEKIKDKDIESILQKKEELFNPLLKLYDSFQKKKTISNFVKSLIEFTKDIELDRRFDEFLTELENNKNSEDDYRRQVAILNFSKDTLDNTIKSIEVINSEDDDEITIEDFRRLIDIGLTDKGIKSIPYSLDQVVVGDVMRSRFDNPKHQIIMGLNQSAIPAGSKDATLIDDKMRNIFKENAIELSQTTKETALNQRFYIYLICTNPTEKLYLSYPRENAEGTADEKSSVIAEIENLFMHEEIDDKGKKVYKTNIIEEKINENNFEFYNVNSVVDYVSANIQDLRKPQSAISDEQRLKNISTKNAIRFLKKNIDKFDSLCSDVFNQANYKEDKNLNEKLAGDLVNVNKEGFNANASEIEAFNSCPYQYFLKYSLKLKDRQDYRIRANDLGDYLHSALEYIFKDNIDLNKLNPAELEKIVDEYLAKPNKKNYKFFEFDKIDNDYFGVNKIEFVKKQCKGILKSALLVLKSFASGSKFNESLEESTLSYEYNGNQFTGRIDRIQTYKNDDGIYVNVIDYKSNRTRKDIKRQEVEDGVSIQLILYLDYCLNQKYKDEKQAISCGSFYFWLEDPIVRLKNFDDRNEVENLKELKNKQLGYVGIASRKNDNLLVINEDLNIDENNKGKKNVKTKEGYTIEGIFLDSEELKNEFDVVHKKIDDTIGDIKKGVIKIKPYNDNVCKWCEYKEVCRKEMLISDEDEE